MKITYSNRMKKMSIFIFLLLLTLFVPACQSNRIEKMTEEENTEVREDSLEANEVKNDSELQQKNEYTMNDMITMSPSLWNPHDQVTNVDRVVGTFTTIGLYGVVRVGDGHYEVAPEMAAAMPEDVTKEYAGDERFGVPKDAAEGYAYKIALNPNACWEDGTPINADTYLYSMEQLLDPKMCNYDAITFLSGTMTLANANEYYHSGEKQYSNVKSNDTYREVPEDEMYFSFTKDNAFLGSSAKRYYESGYQEMFLDEKGNDLYEKYCKGEDYMPLTEEAKKDLLTICSNFGDTSSDCYKAWCFSFDGINRVVGFDEVGIQKAGEYEIILILCRPCKQVDLCQELKENWIVYKKYYEEGKVNTGEMVKTTYGTAVDNYMSYGPYKLTYFQEDKVFTMERNEKWYGYSDGLHKDEYQVTRINYYILTNMEVAMQMFLQGKIDCVELTAERLEKYRSSEYIRFYSNPYTSKLTFNGDYLALKERESAGINKTILSYQEFRQALSLSINRQEIVSQLLLPNRVTYGLLNDEFYVDANQKEIYRKTKQAEGALCKVYDVASVDELTGYDKEKAARLMTQAYEKAYAKGDISDNDIVDLEFLVSSKEESFVKLVMALQNAFLDAAVGTPLEGRIHITMTPDADFYNHAKQGGFEMIISTWGGKYTDPYTVMRCYADERYSYELGFHSKDAFLTINLNGTEHTKSIYDWYQALCNEEYLMADTETRVTILAAMEEFLLEQCYCTPIYARYTANLYSQKVDMGSEYFMDDMKYCGIRYLKYCMTDEQWDAYCEEKDGQLSY